MQVTKSVNMPIISFKFSTIIMILKFLNQMKERCSKRVARCTECNNARIISGRSDRLYIGTNSKTLTTVTTP